MYQTTLSRLLESVFSGNEFTPRHTNINNDGTDSLNKRKVFYFKKYIKSFHLNKKNVSTAKPVPKATSIDHLCNHWNNIMLLTTLNKLK